MKKLSVFETSSKKYGTEAASPQDAAIRQTTAHEVNSNNPTSPSPAAPDEKGQEMVVLPPSFVSGHAKHYRELKSSIIRKKPLYEDFLDSNQKRVLEAASKNFGLFYNIFPVKWDSGFATGSSAYDENDQVRAFELLCAIVARSVRDAIVCSSNRENSVARKEIDCDKPGEVMLRFSKDIDDKKHDNMCSTNDPENALSEECQKLKMTKENKSSLMKVVRGPPIDFTITVASSSSSAPLGSFIKLPPTGGLKDALERQIWKATGPTKIIFTLAPFEFLKGLHFIEKLNRKMIAAFRKRYGTDDIQNIVLVEWPEIFAKRLSITQLATRFLSTAEKLARIILRWHRKAQIQLDQTHFIGTSLGGHVAGVVAKIIKEKTGEQVARITALDPLGWGFDEIDGIGVDPELELSKNDAAFVDVIHTSSPDPNFPYIHYGSIENRGTADFYPNNGRAQYCGKTDGLCHHFYSLILYIASITGANFNGCKCSSWDDFIMKRSCTPCVGSAKMGEHVDSGKASGVYYLATA